MWHERLKKNSLIKAFGDGWSISKRNNQPLDSRLALMAGSTLSKITERSAQILRLLLSFSKASQERLFLNSWTLERDTEGVEGTLLTLVFLGMVLELTTKSTQQIGKRNKNKTKGRLQVSTKKYRTRRTIWCMNRLNNMMRELRQKIKSKLSSNSQNWLEHRVSN